MKARIIVTDEIITDSLSVGKSVTDVLAAKYEGEIADRIKSDERLKNLDAFQFAMMDAGIGKSSVIAEFYKTTESEWLFPVFIDRRLRESVASMNILPYITESIEPVRHSSAQGSKVLWDEDNKDATRKKRVAEGTDLPLAIIKLSDFAITLKKRGRAVQTTYETIMFQTLNMFGKHLDMIANDLSNQQAGDAIEVLVNGDGNKNAADFVSVTGANGLTNEELVIFAIEFWKKSKLPLTTLIAGDGEFFRKLMLTKFNINEINGMMTGSRFNFPQAQLADLTVLYDERVPQGGGKEQMIGLNKDHALTKYVAVGSQIREIDKNIRNQTNLGTISEIANFAKSTDAATLILRAK